VWRPVEGPGPSLFFLLGVKHCVHNRFCLPGKSWPAARVHAVNHSVKITEKTVYPPFNFVADLVVPGGYLSAAGSAASSASTETGEATGEQLRHDTDEGNGLRVVVVTMPPQAITGRRSERSFRFQSPQD